MQFESRLAGLVNRIEPTVDPDDFIARLNTRRQRQIDSFRQIKSGVLAGIMVLAVGLFSQLQINSTVAHLAYLEENYLTEQELAYNEQLVEDTAIYLLAETDDVWRTLVFFDEINFNLVNGIKE